MTVVGDGETDYTEALRQLVSHHRIESFVHFCGAQPKEEMPHIYRRADIFLFTSIWPEPFGRVLIEAMAAGAVVVGSPTGGAAEILVDEENALTFPPGDAEALAKQIMRLANAPAIVSALDRGRSKDRCARKFDATRMTQEIEAYLQAVAQYELDRPTTRRCRVRSRQPNGNDMRVRRCAAHVLSTHHTVDSYFLYCIGELALENATNFNYRRCRLYRL